MAGKLTAEEYAKIKKNILKKLYAHKAFQKGHLLYERLQQGIPPHLSGFVPEVLEKLIEEGIVQ